MDFQAYWELFSKIIWPLLMAYAAYLHRELANVMRKLETLQQDHYDHKVEANKTFVTQATMTVLEARITSMLNRIDDKVTKILEDNR
jgi:Ser/Thr protein kinase RdoA (MazF antagonist)